MTNLQAALRPHLHQGEHLLWVGQPKKGLVFRKRDLFLIPFSLFWLIFVGFWVYLSISSNLFFTLFGSAFVLFGIYFFAGRFFWDARSREHTIYGFTEHRILIKTTAFSENIQSISIRDLNHLELENHKGGEGTIFFGSSLPIYLVQLFQLFSKDLKIKPLSFELIPNATEVFKQLTELQQNSSLDLNKAANEIQEKIKTHIIKR